MENGESTAGQIIGAVESAAINIAEAGLTGGLPGAEAAAITEAAKAAGEVVAAVVERVESHKTDTTTGSVTVTTATATVTGDVSVTGNIAAPTQTESTTVPGQTAPAPTTFNLIEQWARDRNLIGGSNPMAQTLKGMSEYGELADAVLKRDLPNVIDGIGDVVVVLTILAAQHGQSIADCIDAAYNEIKDRKGVMYNGAFIKSDDPRYNDVLTELAAVPSASGAANG